MTAPEFITIHGIGFEEASLAIEPAFSENSQYVAFADDFDETSRTRPWRTSEHYSAQIVGAPEQYGWYFSGLHNIDVDPTKYCRHRTFEDDL